MACIRNTSKAPLMVMGYVLYPGETRDVPEKIAGLLCAYTDGLEPCEAVEQPQPQILPEPEQVLLQEPAPAGPPRKKRR